MEEEITDDIEEIQGIESLSADSDEEKGGDEMSRNLMLGAMEGMKAEILKTENDLLEEKMAKLLMKGSVGTPTFLKPTDLKKDFHFATFCEQKVNDEFKVDARLDPEIHRYAKLETCRRLEELRLKFFRRLDRKQRKMNQDGVFSPRQNKTRCRSLLSVFWQMLLRSIPGVYVQVVSEIESHQPVSSGPGILEIVNRRRTKSDRRAVKGLLALENVNKQIELIGNENELLPNQESTTSTNSNAKNLHKASPPKKKTLKKIGKRRTQPKPSATPIWKTQHSSQIKKKTRPKDPLSRTTSSRDEGVRNPPRTPLKHLRSFSSPEIGRKSSGHFPKLRGTSPASSPSSSPSRTHPKRFPRLPESTDRGRPRNYSLDSHQKVRTL